MYIGWGTLDLILGGLSSGTARLSCSQAQLSWHVLNLTITWVIKRAGWQQISSSVSHSTVNQVTPALSCASLLLFVASDRLFYRRDQSQARPQYPESLLQALPRTVTGCPMRYSSMFRNIAPWPFTNNDTCHSACCVAHIIQTQGIHFAALTIFWKCTKVNPEWQREGKGWNLPNVFWLFWVCEQIKGENVVIFLESSVDMSDCLS